MDKEGADQNNKINHKEILDEHQSSIDNLELSLEKIQKESEILKDLQLQCTEYVRECTKEVRDALWWRNKFSWGIAGYFIVLNLFTLFCLDYFEIHQKVLWFILVQNSILLITPLVSYFKSYGERNKNDYYPPAIKSAIGIALKKFGNPNHEL